MRLIDETDIATRAAVSVRLAPHACAPRPIMLQLARDVLEVAEPVLLHSPVLTPADCEAIIVERGVCYADILARRGQPTVAAAPEPAPAPAPAPAVAAPVVLITPPASPPPLPVIEESASDEAAVQDDAEAANEGTAARAVRTVLRGRQRRAPADPDQSRLCANGRRAQPPAPLQRADVWRLETAALRHHTGALMRELERALGISYQQSRRIVEDELGEPIVVAGKAMSLPADVLQRIVLFMNPRVGQSVDRVYELAALYNEISVEAARRLVAILRAAAPADEPQKTGDTRAICGTAETARRALSDVAATTARSRPEVVLRRARRRRRRLTFARARRARPSAPPTLSMK